MYSVSLKSKDSFFHLVTTGNGHAEGKKKNVTKLCPSKPRDYLSTAKSIQDLIKSRFSLSNQWKQELWEISI